MKYAIFSDLAPTFSTQIVYDEKRAQFTELVRVSEWVDIDFPPLAAVDALREVALIDKKIAACRADNDKRLNVLETARANLLALRAPHNNTTEKVS